MAVIRLGTLLLVAGALIVGTSVEAGQSATAPAASASEVASPAAQKPMADKATAARSTKSAAAKKGVDLAAVLIRDARNAGFTAENVGGTQMFCRLEAELESRFLVKTCYDEVQVRIKIEQYRTERNELEAIHHLQ